MAMTQAAAREIAGRYLQSLQAGMPVALAINDDVTEQHAAGFVFFYNSAAYWRTHAATDALAGNGPILVKDDGTVLILPTNQSVAVSVAAL